MRVSGPEAVQVAAGAGVNRCGMTTSAGWHAGKQALDGEQQLGHSHCLALAGPSGPPLY